MREKIYKCNECGYLSFDFNEGQCPKCMTTDALEEDGYIEDPDNIEEELIIESYYDYV